MNNCELLPDQALENKIHCMEYAEKLRGINSDKLHQDDLKIYADTVIELLTVARNGKYDDAKPLSDNFALAYVSITRDAFSQNLYQQLAPAV